MSGLFAGTSLERPVTCPQCGAVVDDCTCPKSSRGTATKPNQMAVRVGLEKRRKGKMATVLRGVDLDDDGLKGVLKKLKTALGTGGTIAVGLIELQGDARDRAIAWLKANGYTNTKKSGG